MSRLGGKATSVKAQSERTGLDFRERMDCEDQWHRDPHLKDIMGSLSSKTTVFHVFHEPCMAPVQKPYTLTNPLHSPQIQEGGPSVPEILPFPHSVGSASISLNGGGTRTTPRRPPGIVPPVVGFLRKKPTVRNQPESRGIPGSILPEILVGLPHGDPGIS